MMGDSDVAADEEDVAAAGGAAGVVAGFGSDEHYVQPIRRIQFAP
jgi:hypothetical protein